MKNIIVFTLVFCFSACKKSPKCIAGDTLIKTTHRNSLECNNYKNVGFLFKTMDQLEKFIDSIPCNYSSNFIIPLNFSKSWMIGYSVDVDYFKFETLAELYKDTCDKEIKYNFILKLDTTSGLRDPNYKAIEIRYCLIPAFPLDYKVIYTKEIRYEKLP